MKSLLKFASVLLIVFACQNYSFAQETEKKYMPVRFLIGAAMEFGGDEVAKVQFTNGDTQSVKAGQGVSLAVGGEFQLPKLEKLLLRATVGYKYVTTMADNAHIRLTRVPLHVTANWMLAKKLRISAGIVNHQGIKFNAGGIGDNGKLKSSTGPIFEIAYHGVGLTYTAMTYKDQADLSYSANAIGVSFTTTIPGR
jgi:hypothetical protein